MQITNFQLFCCSLFLNLLWSSTFHAQIQLGGDIDGEAAGDYSGWSVALDGNRVAIGAHLNDDASSNAGHVRVYEWTGTAWTQLGGDIDGEAANDYSGCSVALLGNRLAIGAYLNDDAGNNAGHVRVYEWSGSAWNQLGGDIDGESIADGSGIAVSLSGNRLAVGAHDNEDGGNSAGHVRVYEWSGSAWNQLGGDIDGEAAGDYSGWSVALDGSRVAIGSPTNGNATGHVRVYEWSGSAWNQLGGDIDGEAANDYSGFAVSLDGNRVAIGAPNNDNASGVDAGHVRIYEWTGSAWTQLGMDIDGEAAGDGSGFAVSLDGNRVAVGAPSNDNASGVDAGHVRIYEWTGSVWAQLGIDIDGEATNDWSARAISLAGNRVAIGAPFNDENGNGSGHTRVYIFEQLLPVKWMNFSAYVEGTGVRLDWQTARENNNAYFTAEKSKTAEHWELLCKIEGAGESNRSLSYTAKDEAPYYDVPYAYYRIKQTDLDGQSQYSEVKSVYLSQSVSRRAVIYPNPARGTVTLEASEQKLGKIRIYDLLGRDWTHKIELLPITSYIINIDISKLPAGLYTLETNVSSNRFYKLPQ